MGIILQFAKHAAPVGSLVTHSEHGVVEVLERRGAERKIEAVLYDDNGECLGAELIWVAADSLEPVRDHIDATGVESFQMGT